MEKLSFGYSTKNIPVGPRSEYLIRLIGGTEHLVKRMRWRAFFFLNPNKNTTAKETYGFKTSKPAPMVNELNQFEKLMTELIQNVKFNNHMNDFQQKLQKDIKSINNENKMLIKADKTTNFYKLKTDTYSELIRKNVTKDYKKANDQTINKITQTDKKIATQLELDDRIETIAPKEAFITIKDHKNNFQNNPTCRLINPMKSEIGKISKKLLENINSELTSKTDINIWKNSYSVIDWFNKLENKKLYSFITFDVCDFYPSINEKLLNKALDYAEKYVTITKEQRETILHAKRSIMQYHKQHWIKKDSKDMFDVTMGSYDGAETCELVGTYLLTLLPKQLKNNIGLYRDDGLAVCKASARNIENLKKQICTIFKNNNLKITIEANKKIIDFLDITFNLTDETYRPYTKPGNKILYIDSKSNHPPAIIKNLPENVNRRLNSISSNIQQFKQTVAPYQQALENSGYKYKLEYKEYNKSKHSRKRKITWYNPPYSANVRTNIGKQFLKLIDHCFPPTHKLNKIFNKNTLKLSYSCLPNIKNKIDGHNKKILNKNLPETPQTRTCNCRQKDQCPLDGNCLAESLIYQATVTRQDNKTDETYIGLCETNFKTRFNNHKTTFRYGNKRSTTELSKHIWKLKDDNINYKINWKIMRQCKSYNNTTKKCNLCLFEKYLIICKQELCSLNKRNELASLCRHAKRYLLCNSDG